MGDAGIEIPRAKIPIYIFIPQLFLGKGKVGILSSIYSMFSMAESVVIFQYYRRYLHQPYRPRSLIIGVRVSTTLYLDDYIHIYILGETRGGYKQNKKPRA